MGSTTVVPPAFSKWSAPPKKPDAEPPKPKPPPGLLSAIPQILNDGKKTYSTLNKDLATAPVIMELAFMTKLPHANVLIYLIAAALYVICVAAGFFSGFLTYALAFGWPVVMSLRAAESCKKEDVQAWLSYWIIVSLMTLVEYGGSTILNLLPFYYFFKMVFILWLIIPYFRGSLVLYNLVLKHILPPIKKPDPPKEEKKKEEVSKWAYPVKK
ncbi:TB2/DP1, HVA22 family-domain-containing protein [Obelidium mucronatum]|nr:TB2/DP1, HVA22 family-domain-containing protein [Obelidium mucronatum]